MMVGSTVQATAAQCVIQCYSRQQPPHQLPSHQMAAHLDTRGVGHPVPPLFRVLEPGFGESGHLL